jgi:diguanylate cyclase (GGDEF)-like protein
MVYIYLFFVLCLLFFLVGTLGVLKGKKNYDEYLSKISEYIEVVSSANAYSKMLRFDGGFSVPKIQSYDRFMSKSDEVIDRYLKRVDYDLKDKKDKLDCLISDLDSRRDKIESELKGLNDKVYKSKFGTLDNREAFERDIKNYDKSDYKKDNCGDGENKTYGVFIDLTNFKYLNDTCGHRYGDKVLVATNSAISDSSKLAKKMGVDVSNYHFCGDEYFAVVKAKDFSLFDKFVSTFSKILPKMVKKRMKNDLKVDSFAYNIGAYEVPFDKYDDKESAFSEAMHGADVNQGVYKIAKKHEGKDSEVFGKGYFITDKIDVASKVLSKTNSQVADVRSLDFKVLPLSELSCYVKEGFIDNRLEDIANRYLKNI